MERRAIEHLRLQVLHLHKSLIDDARHGLERLEGRLSPHQFLDRLMHDPELAWLKPLSALIVALDECLDASDADPAAADQLAAEVRSLLVADPDGDPFQRRYGEPLQRSPTVVLAHAAALRALR